MQFLVLEEAKGQRDNQERDHEVFYKRERVYACFDGSRETHIPVNEEFYNAAKFGST